MSKSVNVAVVGATGAVGKVMVRILEARNFPIDNLYLLGSDRSAGTLEEFHGVSHKVKQLDKFDFSNVDLGLFSAGATVSADFVPKAVRAGGVVVDNTSQFRRDPGVPLVVPEVNLHALKAHRGIIANPNCSTMQMVVALKPIYDAVGIKRINVATYQSVSGGGKKAIDELLTQTTAILNGESPIVEVCPKQIAFNAVPHIDTFEENGYTREEMKMVWETQKIFEDDSILVNPTAVRIPVFYGHSEAVHIETREPIGAFEAKKLLSSAPGGTVLDERAPGGYPTAVTEAENRDQVYVGRIREDITCDTGLDLWIVSDNIRKGAALNSVQICEHLLSIF